MNALMINQKQNQGKHDKYKQFKFGVHCTNFTPKNHEPLRKHFHSNISGELQYRNPHNGFFIFVVSLQKNVLE